MSLYHYPQVYNNKRTIHNADIRTGRSLLYSTYNYLKNPNSHGLNPKWQAGSVRYSDNNFKRARLLNAWKGPGFTPILGRKNHYRKK